jgi:hypothetical protein
MLLPLISIYDHLCIFMSHLQHVVFLCSIVNVSLLLKTWIDCAANGISNGVQEMLPAICGISMQSTEELQLVLGDTVLGACEKGKPKPLQMTQDTQRLNLAFQVHPNYPHRCPRRDDAHGETGLPSDASCDTTHALLCSNMWKSCAVQRWNITKYQNSYWVWLFCWWE